MNKVLLVTSPRAPYSDYIHFKILENKYNVDVTYSLIGSFNNKLLRFIRKYWVKYLPFKSIFYEKKIKMSRSYDYIIILRDQYSEIIAKYIKRISDAKIIIYFMDPISKSVFFNKPDFSGDYIISSFEKEACLKYGFIYNPLFFFEEKVCSNFSLDVFFIGTDKGRLSQLLSLKDIFLKFSLKCEFIICKSPNSKYKDKKEFKYDKKIPYLDVIKKEITSRALLEILPEGQKDMTLRCYEAYFLKKKLITNNLDVINYSFYDERNVFVLGKDNLDDLNAFIKQPYYDFRDEFMENSRFENRLKIYIGE